ncbi:PAS domain-containing protein [Methanosarcina sp.]|uniref:PAS domain-containing protein n=1 Tax=Methanosarcina sp. TaxID=2213 RepID=UPI002AB9A23A|nr:PAS domain-containing protein [Methanosarcina sp.]MDY9927712.1 PAS domain-containing protein [Methanosarcina sp.]
MEEKLKKSGIDVIGEIPWGTHFCQFYQTKEDLMDILIPYFKTGLENNEFCMWVTSQVLDVDEAKKALRKAVPYFDAYLEKAQIEIISYADWYLKSGTFDVERTINNWAKKTDQALNGGYDGLRLTGDTSWLKKNWDNLIDYEEKLDGAIENRRIIALCTYSSRKFDTNETIYMALNHRFVLVKREGNWEKIENPRLKRAEARTIQATREVETKSKEANENLEKLLEERTVQLEKTCKLLKESEKCLSQAQKMAHIGNWKWNIITGELSWSEEVYRIFGRDLREFGATYDAFLSYVHPDDREYVINAIKKGFNGEPQSIDYRIILPSGEVRTVHTQTEITFNENNIPVRAEGVVQDITGHKRTEEELRKSEAWLQVIIANSPDIIFEQDRDLRYIWIFNPASSLSVSDVVGKTDADLLPPDQAQQLESIKRRVLDTGISEKVILQLAPNGKPRWYEAIYEPHYDAGQVIGVLSYTRDITERKQLEEQTRQRAEEVETVMEVVPVAIWIGHDPQCQNITGNRMANEFYGAETGENVSANVTPLRRFFREGRELSTEELPLQEAALKDIDVRNVETDVLLPSGEWQALLGSASPLHGADGRVRGSVGAFMDITERKKAEVKLKETLDNLEHIVKVRTAELQKAYNSLKESEASLAEAQRIAHIGNWDWDLVTNELHWSNELYRIFGLNPQESDASFDKALNYIHPEDRKNVDNAIKRALKGKNYGSIDYRIVLADGEEHIVHGQGEVIFNEENSPVRIRGTLQDITERKRTEKALELSEERYRIIAERTGQLVYDYNIAEDTADWAGNIKEITGYTPEKYRNMSLEFLLSRIHPEDRKMFQESYERFLTYGGTYRTEYRFRKEDGEYIYVEDNGVCLKDEKGKVKRILGAIKDITERKKAEKALANIEIARKREIYHRIKNNLQVISSLLDLQAEKFKHRKHAENSEVLAAFRESQERVMSIALIHEELHKGSRTDKLDFSPYLQKLVDNLFEAYRLGDIDISLNMELEENIFFGTDIAVSLGLIVNEIVSNSLKYAFSGRDKGTIRIKLYREKNKESTGKIQGRKEDYKNKTTNFALAISDNGVGLPENFNIEDSDTLGLQLISVLIDQLDGKLELRRDLGTEFIIRFAVSEKE